MFNSLFRALRTKKNKQPYFVKACIYVNDTPVQDVHLPIQAFSKRQAIDKFNEMVEIRVQGAIKNRKKK